MSSKFVQLQIEDRIAVLTLSRPEQRNAIGSHEDCAELVSALETVDGSPDVSVLILTGAGSAFCAGGDLKAMKERRGIGALESPVATRANYKKGVHRVALALAALEVATIAAVNGPAIGLGCDIAALCDIRIASETAKFAASFVKVGIVPGDGGAWILPRTIGYSNAAEMILTGDVFSAAQARDMGLVSRVVPAAALMDEAQAVARRIAVNPLQSLRLAKRLLREGQTARFSEVLELSAAFQALVHETSDHKEALDAFLEKRTPNFTGR